MAAPLPSSSLFFALLLLLLSLSSSSAHSSKPNEKECILQPKPSANNFSLCDGVIRCPDTCPDCVLSCVYCGMSHCPKCNKVGSVCQDPRFVGGDGVMFYFHGHKDADFCIVSDPTLHINAHFIGKRTPGRPRDFTWMQAIAILFHTHKLYIGAKRVGKWNPQLDQFVLYFDGSSISLPLGEGGKWVSSSGEVMLTRMERANSLSMEIPGLLKSSISIVPVTKEESRVHLYEISDTDCFAHLELNFDFLTNLSLSVSGVLGQTYAPGYVNPVKRGVAMPIMGGEDNYLASSIFTPDCAVAQFNAHASIEPQYSIMSGINREIISCGSDGAGGSGLVCKK